MLRLLIAVALVLLVGCGARTGVASGRPDLDDGGTLDASELPITATVEAATLSQDCMPAIAADPVRAELTLQIANPTAQTIGPATIAVVEVRDDATDALVATFAIDETLGPIAPGKAVNEKVVKTPKSLSPQKGCAAVPCAGLYHFVVVITGPGMPEIRAPSEPLAMSCTF